VDGLPASLGLPPFRERFPWWGGDLQTLHDTLSPRPTPTVAMAAARVEIPIGEEDALLGWLDPPLRPPAGALALLVHGLGGGAESRPIRRLAAVLSAAGFAVLRLNLRGAGRGRALARGTYAARCERDLAPALRRARELAQGTPLVGVGISLGGTVLLNACLARGRGGAGTEPRQPALDALACISSPLDLPECSRRIDRPRNRLYQRWLLARLCRQTLADPHGVSALEAERLSDREMRSLRAFDAAITAPRWGHASVDAYYRAASPLPDLLAGCPLPPTLLVQAADDPWVTAGPARLLLEQRGGAGGPEVVLTRCGGHYGFHGQDDRSGPGPAAPWSERLTARWLARQLN
jgi:predicted alpha/beta-fold hydrolase